MIVLCPAYRGQKVCSYILTRLERYIKQNLFWKMQKVGSLTGSNGIDQLKYDFFHKKTGLQPVSRPSELVHYFGG